MVDLHLHTTASDGRLSPHDLVTRAAAAGLTVISVTDHDTTAGLADARRTARRLGVRFVEGIEITAVENARDVHVLGYFFDPEDPGLATFLDGQRRDRQRRVREMGARLAGLGCPIDVDALLENAARHGGRSVGRPLLADALVAAGYALDRDDAFERLLANGRPAFVPRRGATVAGIVEIIKRAGGIASLAHPALTCVDDAIPRFAAAGLGAIEVRHIDHDRAAEKRYRRMAASLGVAVSGGSDYHADPARDAELGTTTLPRVDFDRLEARAGHAHARGGGA